MAAQPVEILELLRSKNRCLGRLMTITRVFLATPIEELVAERAEEPGPLAEYETNRAAIIVTLQMHDRKVGSLIANLPSSLKTPKFLEEAAEELTRHERLILSIFNADDLVFRKLGEAQSQITRLLKENRKNREILGRFKSAPVHTGEEMDKTL